tara:strand:+ start:25942 stop:27324 length:1383 start_codon:yes stop_codon:yes gene_type:complete
MIQDAYSVSNKIVRVGDNKMNSISQFASMQIKPEIVTALEQEGIVTPTNIQEKAIPLIKEGKDVIGMSRTGSGKTASFGIPLLEKVVPKQGVQGLILAPTRELANQISNELRKWGKNLDIRIATVFGGVALDPQTDKIAVSEIVVGTPGRILDHLERGNLELNGLNCFVLDEADKMVEMGFIEPIEYILKATPDNRQIVLFGATLSTELDYLKNKYMSEVAVAESELQVEKDLLEQYYYNTQPHQKFSLLAHLITQEETDRVMIFCSKRSTVELVHKNLRANGIKAEMIHGKMRQNKRLQVIERFNSDKCNILVASSVAARGLDIRNVSHVFNYDLGQDPQEYIHRVGRTARAGESGKAITLITQQDYAVFNQILDRFNVDPQELEAGEFPKLRFDAGMRRGGNSFRGGQGRGYQGRGGSRGYQGSRPPRTGSHRSQSNSYRARSSQPRAGSHRGQDRSY